MDKLKDKIKRSYFIVNKLYVFLIFILLFISDIALAFIYFLFSIFIYMWKTMTSRVPMSVSKDIPMKTFIYKNADKRDLKMDIYYPTTHSKKNFPLVYFCHGGGWISGFRNQPNNVSWCRYLASKGLSVASIDYRYGYKNSMEDILEDYSDGLNYIKSRAEKLNIDKNNVVLMGLSAGGHLALLYSSYNTFMGNRDTMNGIRSLVAYYSPSDLKDIFTEDNKSLFAKFGAAQTLKGKPSEEDDIYDYYSPISWLSEKMIPTLVVHGKMDNTVPFISSVKLVKKFKDYNVPHEFWVHKNADHSFDTKLKDYTTINILEKTVRFIKKSIKVESNYEDNKD